MSRMKSLAHRDVIDACFLEDLPLHVVPGTVGEPLRGELGVEDDRPEPALLPADALQLGQDDRPGPPTPDRLRHRHPADLARLAVDEDESARPHDAPGFIGGHDVIGGRVLLVELDLLGNVLLPDEDLLAELVGGGAVVRRDHPANGEGHGDSLAGNSPRMQKPTSRWASCTTVAGATVDGLTSCPSC